MDLYLAAGPGLFLAVACALTLRQSEPSVLPRTKGIINTFRVKSREKHGSFLLAKSTSSNHISTAHEAAIAEHLRTVEVKKENLTNEEVGHKLISIRDTQMGPNVSVFYKQDGGLVVTHGKGTHMIDVDGVQYLDCCNNVACVGHSHPRVVKAGQDELGKVQTNGRFLNPVQQRYLAKLLATFPPELNTVYLVNSGSEANDLALRIAKEHASRKGKAAYPNDIICLDSAYHGHTAALVDISPYKWYQAVDDRDYQPSSTHVATLPDGYRGKHALGQTEECGAAYAADVEELVEAMGGVGTFIAESIVGCGGQVVPPPTYLQRCYAAVRAGGGVCIADEVQTGFGRGGSDFWMFQTHGVVPDIVTFGKPMGNGYPVAAVVCRRELADSFASTGIEYFNTFGGNSVACSIAEAVLDTILEEDLQQNSLVVGQYMLDSLNELKLKHSWIGDVRGWGLFQGVEFVEDNSSKSPKPFARLTKFIVDHMRYDQVIVSRDGPDENVIKIKPPLVFSKENVDTLVAAMKRALESATQLGVF